MGNLLVQRYKMQELLVIFCFCDWKKTNKKQKDVLTCILKNPFSLYFIGCVKLAVCLSQRLPRSSDLYKGKIQQSYSVHY